MAGSRLLALVGGALAGLALPPLGSPPLLWLGLALLWQLSARQRPWQLGGIWGLAAVMVSHRWLLGLHPLTWIGVPEPLSLPLCWLLLAICAGAGGVLVGGWLSLAAWLGPRRSLAALAMAGLWGLVEVALAKGPLFWIGIGAAALPGDRPLAGLAALVGAGGLAAVQLLVAWGLWRCLQHLTARRWRPFLLSGLVVALAVVGLQALGTRVLAAQPLEQTTVERVLVLQPAIPTREKFTWPQQLRLRQLLRAALAEGDQRQASTVLLPEGALGLDPELDQPAPVELISGGFRWQEVGGEPQQRSALLRFPPGTVQPTDALDKHRVVPLGEWVPLAGLVRWSGLSAVGGVEPGPAPRLLQRPEASIAGAICYELSDGEALAAATRDGARWLLASANLDPYPLMLQRQFSALAQLRAIETGRWLVSAANTGPSLLVNAKGEVVAQLPAGRAVTGLFTVPQLSNLTFYARFGDGPLLLLTAAVGAAAVLSRVQGSRQPN
ncbi:MAG: apolipoprotein N-acyltransferase [Cyanobacteriota bacterium]|nr:apolipoprotein N-acyltransferase [Cyanobacteriota bacterium]